MKDEKKSDTGHVAADEYNKLHEVMAKYRDRCSTFQAERDHARNEVEAIKMKCKETQHTCGGPFCANEKVAGKRVRRTVEFYWNGEDIGPSTSATVTVDFGESLFFNGEVTEEDDEVIEQALRSLGETLAKAFEAENWWTERQASEAHEWCRKEMEGQ